MCLAGLSGTMRAGCACLDSLLQGHTYTQQVGYRTLSDEYATIALARLQLHDLASDLQLHCYRGHVVHAQVSYCVALYRTSLMCLAFFLLDRCNTDRGLQQCY